MEDAGRAILAASEVTGADVTVSRTAEMRYVGQGHEVDVEIPPAPLGPGMLDAVVQRFETAYRALYHRTPRTIAIEALNWRLRVAGPVPAFNVASTQGAPPGAVDSRAALKGTRTAYFAEAGGFVETAVYDRYRLAAGATFDGPAIVEERESTTVIGPGGRCRVEPYGGLLVEIRR
jgi:N-methylhydantoinase A/oxoprolinase/acetone carboxylase beta subunit